MVAVTSVDPFLFLAFSDLTCHLEDTGMVFSGCTVPSDSKETELGSSDQEASPSAGKNMFTHGCASLQMFLVVWIFLRSLGVICYDR